MAAYHYSYTDYPSGLHNNTLDIYHCGPIRGYCLFASRSTLTYIKSEKGRRSHMNTENKEQDGVQVVEEQDFITEVADIKANMVPKEQYEVQQREIAKLKHAILNGVQSGPAEPKKSIKELRDEYSKSIKDGVTNAKGFETVLKLREAVIEETGNDPFMTEALEKIDPEFGERVASNLQSMIDDAEGDPQMFNALMAQRVTGK